MSTQSGLLEEFLRYLELTVSEGDIGSGVDVSVTYDTTPSVNVWCTRYAEGEELDTWLEWNCVIEAVE